jgi:hypothetical protein
LSFWFAATPISADSTIEVFMIESGDLARNERKITELQEKLEIPNKKRAAIEPRVNFTYSYILSNRKR